MDLKKLCTLPEFITFHEELTYLMNIAEQSGSCIGFNFKDDNLLSIKFYYVFFEKFNFRTAFPIPELEDEYNRRINKVANTIYDISSPGCGLTFAIKFDNLLNSTKGFFFRMEEDNSNFVTNIIKNYPEFNFKKDEFENGYGVFVTRKNDVISESNYIYLKNTSILKQWEDEYDISFSNAERIEINNANIPNRNQKFLLVHEKSKINQKFYNKIPKSLVKVIKNWDINLWCPAVNPSNKSYSVYIFNKPVLHNPDNNLITNFFNRVTNCNV